MPNKRKITQEQLTQAYEYYMSDEYITLQDAATYIGVAASTLGWNFQQSNFPSKGYRRPKSSVVRRERSSNWRGGRYVSSDGYVHIIIEPDDHLFSMARASGYVAEHRYVMACYLGRPLMKHETVHHIDGNRQNNDITNLQLRIGSHGEGQAYCCSDCGSKRIEPVVI